MTTSPTIANFASKGRVTLEGDFLGPTLLTEWAGVAENSGTAAIVAAKAGGQVNLVTGASDGNRAHLWSGLNHLLSEGSGIVTFIASNRTSILTRALFFGFTDVGTQETPIEISGTTVTANAANAVGFVYDTAATSAIWYIQGVADTAATALKAAVWNGDSSLVPVAETQDEFTIIVSSGDGSSGDLCDATFYINGENVGTVKNAISNDVLLTPIANIETRTTAAMTLWVDYGFCESGRDRTPAD